MIGYAELAKQPVFSIKDVERLTGNTKTAYSLLYRLMQKKLVVKIRNNLYSCISVETDSVIATKYQIASAINNEACVSHISALEYYGYSNQVRYEVYVASMKSFNSFRFQDIRYVYTKTKFNKGIVTLDHTGGIRITDLERTVIDSIKDFEKIGGLEELLQCLHNITWLDSAQVLQYLDMYAIQMLYQKVGFILSHYKESLKLSKELFDHCKRNIGKSVRYLSSHNKKGMFIKEWNLIVDKNSADSLGFQSGRRNNEL